MACARAGSHDAPDGELGHGCGYAPGMPYLMSFTAALLLILRSPEFGLWTVWAGLGLMAVTLVWLLVDTIRWLSS